MRLRYIGKLAPWCALVLFQTGCSSGDPQRYVVNGNQAIDRRIAGEQRTQEEKAKFSQSAAAQISPGAFQNSGFTGLSVDNSVTSSKSPPSPSNASKGGKSDVLSNVIMGTALGGVGLMLGGPTASNAIKSISQKFSSKGTIAKKDDGQSKLKGNDPGSGKPPSPSNCSPSNGIAKNMNDENNAIFNKLGGSLKSLTEQQKQRGVL